MFTGTKHIYSCSKTVSIQNIAWKRTEREKDKNKKTHQTTIIMFDNKMQQSNGSKWYCVRAFAHFLDYMLYCKNNRFSGWQFPNFFQSCYIHNLTVLDENKTFVFHFTESEKTESCVVWHMQTQTVWHVEDLNSINEMCIIYAYVAANTCVRRCIWHAKCRQERKVRTFDSHWVYTWHAKSFSHCYLTLSLFC